MTELAVAPQIATRRRLNPALAAGLIALLARKLSRRLRVVSARLSEQNS